MTLHATIDRVTDRIRERSQQTRSAYLTRIAKAAEDGPRRAHLSCGNQAHAYAGMDNKDDLALSRKPNIGMVERACSELFVARAGSWVIGDQTRDIEMARRAGVRSVLVRTGHGGGDRTFGARPDFEAADISAAADIILGTAKA